MTGRFEMGSLQGEFQVLRTGNQVTVTRGDRISRFNVVEGATLVQLVSGDRKFDAAVHYQKNPEVQVWINGRTLHFKWSRPSAFSRAAEPHGSERTITALLPGRVIRVNVKPGDLVDAGASLVVLEAMKMENEIKAGIAGKVAEVAVRPGMSVETGALLVRLEETP